MTHLASEMVLVARDSVEVGVHANPVGEHLLLVVEIPIGAEVVSEIHSLVDLRRGGGGRLRGPVLPGSHRCQSEKREGKEGEREGGRRNKGGSTEHSVVL